MRHLLVIGVMALTVALQSDASPATGDDREEIRKVFVINFPGLQKVEGSVSIEGHVRHATFQRLKEILVPPVDPQETGRLIDAGLLTTDGFTSVVLSLNGQTRGRTMRAGSVGAILIPEEDSTIRAFEDEGQAEFALETSASITSGATRSFASSPGRQLVGFPRYRVRLYNTTDKTVTVNLFAYLTN